MPDATDATDATDASLADQYEAYPYPQRDPRDEARRLIIGSPSHLREIDHWVFQAARPTSTPLRALFAGGGTGDGTIMLAQHLATAARPGHVSHLDRSAPAQAIARARATARGLDISFHLGSLLDLASTSLGPFDYIDCCGVLHHLPDPQAGLEALLSVLAPGGGLGLMLYAPHGRTGVYMLQDALRSLAPPTDPPAARLDIARRVMRHLPETAWLRANRYFGDHIDGGDAGLYDLLLNPRDRAYDIPSLITMLQQCGLTPTCLMEPMRYDPAPLLPDPKLRARLQGMDLVQRAALAEQLAGNMSTHVVYCTRTAEPHPAIDPTHPAAIPIAREMPAPEIARAIRPDGTLPMLFDGLRVPIPLPPLAPAILRLIDGHRPVAAIAAALAERGTSPETFAKAWPQTFTPLAAANRILLAAPPAPAHPLPPPRPPPMFEQPYIVVFGAAVRPDGSPSGALRDRVGAAARFGRRLLPQPIYIVTGAQGRYGPPEAEIMAELLLQRGIHPDYIVIEPAGTNTLRSAIAVANLLHERPGPVYAATSGYHMPRCVLLLGLAGLDAHRSPPAIGPASSRLFRNIWWRIREFPAIPIDALLMVWHRRVKGFQSPPDDLPEPETTETQPTGSA